MPESASSSTSALTPAGFGALALDPALLRAVDKLGFETMTPIQAEAIPVLLQGHDVIGRARTGSGKTAAFGLPLLNHVRSESRKVQALVLTPTRELALQVSKAMASFATERRVDVLTVYGGAPFHPQFKALSRGVQVVVGTPGRVLDHIRRGSLDLSTLEFFVLDEADEMLSMGFIDDIEEILAGAPKERQTALFSATMAPQMRRIANKWLRDPIEIQVESGNLSVGHITQQWMRVHQRDKLHALVRVLDGTERGTTLVFVRTKAGCAEVADELAQRGYPVDALHGDLNQNARERVTQRLRNGVLEIVIATDVAARGIDIDHITHVINLDLPRSAEGYVHRIGRTGRAGRDGVAISFATPSEARSMPSLARKLKANIENVRVPTEADVVRRQSEAIRTHIGAMVGQDILEPARRWVAAALDNDEEWTIDELAAAAVFLLAQANGIEMTNASATRKPVERRDSPPTPKAPRAAPARRDSPPIVKAPRAAPARRDISTMTKAPSEPVEHRDSAATAKIQRAPAEHRDSAATPKVQSEPVVRRDLALMTKHQRIEAINEVELYLSVGRSQGIRPATIVGVLTNDAGVSPEDIGMIDVEANKSFVGMSRSVAEALVRDVVSLQIGEGSTPLSIAHPRQKKDYGPRRNHKKHRGR